MAKILIIANKSEQMRELSSELVQKGFSCLVIASEAKQSHKITENIAEQSPSAVLVDMTGSSVGSELWELPQRIKEVIASKAKQPLPIIALISKGMLDSFNKIIHGKGFPQNRNCEKGFLALTPSFFLSIDDFVVTPWETTEVAARIKRILGRTNNIGGEDIVGCGDLVIDAAKCQVSLGSKLITLTFREYQLLKFLASNQGRVFTRETLLNKVWGWDYYGGDRTVDVHIRRLRSKIEDRNHSFIETVRNIGYRFKEM